jgi:hypothetical protein
MRIECVSNLAKLLPDELIRPEIGLGRDHVYSLRIGKQYVVYGITWFLGYLWYYICDEDNLFYPVWNPSPLFTIVDNRLSSFWHLGIYASAAGEHPMPIFAFKEWVENPSFYDRLTDGDNTTVAVFKKYKQLMDEEAG